VKFCTHTKILREICYLCKREPETATVSLLLTAAALTYTSSITASAAAPLLSLSVLSTPFPSCPTGSRGCSRPARPQTQRQRPCSGIARLPPVTSLPVPSKTGTRPPSHLAISTYKYPSCSLQNGEQASKAAYVTEPIRAPRLLPGSSKLYVVLAYCYKLTRTAC
jgi:hypothetical protein